MSLKRIYETKVIEERGEYKDFIIVVGTQKQREGAPVDYVLIKSKNHEIQDLEYLFQPPCKGKLFNKTPTGSGLDVNICQNFRTWTFSGFEIEDLDGLTAATNEVLEKLRQRKDYPHKWFFELLIFTYNATFMEEVLKQEFFEFKLKHLNNRFLLLIRTWV